MGVRCCPMPVRRLLFAVLAAGGAGQTACARPVVSVDDVMAAGDGEVELVAFVEREPLPGLRKGVVGATVRFSIDGRVVGSARSDDDGRARLATRVANQDAARVEASAEVDGRACTASASIFHWRGDRVIIVVDIDDTICDTDKDKLILRSADTYSRPIEGSKRTLAGLSKEYYLLYLTARPRFLLDKTRKWLADNNYPEGPLFTSPGVRSLMDQLTFKRAMLAKLRRRWPAALIGIGNEPHDAEAYGASNMLALIVLPAEKRFGHHALLFSDWRAVEAFFRANRDTLTSAERLGGAIAGRRLLLVPVVPYRDEK